ncbi:MAG: efflux RND transporter permease subunit [Oligoflexales bacterium]|nr:efflux RND transporter permease subunit [Oligoflexales bacterium]
MVDAIISFSLRHRFTILFAAISILSYGIWTGINLPIDVFPNLNRPKVTVMSEAHGLAPEEVEALVTIPVETNLQGIPGVIGIRSTSSIGISIIHVDFEWGTDSFKNRLLVSEKLQTVRTRIPKDIEISMAPITSIMGEIQFVGLKTTNDKISAMEAREFADFILRPALMGIQGISQVVVMGGGMKQYQILLKPSELVKRQLSFEDVKAKIETLGRNTTGGMLNADGLEYLIRPFGRVNGIVDIENTYVGMHLGQAVLVKDIATVAIGEKEKRGNSSINGSPAVVMTIQKQPDADTVTLTKNIDVLLAKIEKTLPEGLALEKDLFKQSHFIESSIHNVAEALRDGTLMVAIVLFFFLLNFRTTFITLTAIPLSFVVTFIIFKAMGLSINTMTLGGLAIAVGELVDDAIVDVENVFRRLRENNLAGKPKSALKVVFEASSEIRNSLVISTLIVIAVFLPLFALSGIEGRFFTPLGLSYIISLGASLLVSITLTPVLCLLLLPNSKAIAKPEETVVIRFVKKLAKNPVSYFIRHPLQIITFILVCLSSAIILFTRLESNFLPSFNEGTATIGVASYPGISLPESDALGKKIEKAIMSVSEVKSTIRRTGRAEMDEHAEGVHWHEIDVDFNESDRDKKLVLDEVRQKIEAVGDVYVNVGQPISHRIDHMMSGVRSQIAIKVFGSDLVELRRIAVDIEDQLKKIEGLVDISIEALVKVPELAISIDHVEANRHGLVPGQLAEQLEDVLNGVKVADFIENQRIFDITMRVEGDLRSSSDKISELIVGKKLTGEPIALSQVADIYETESSNAINRDELRRRIVISANTSGRALSGIDKEIIEKIESNVKLAPGYTYALGGQFEAQKNAKTQILVLGLISLLVIIFILYGNFRSLSCAMIILVNVPLALIGSVWAIYIAGTDLSLATLVAFITLCGIACRNGLLMVSHYLHLRTEKPSLSEKEVVIQGTLERLIPVLMTAGTAILALTPLLLAKGEPGKEILHPVAVVIVGGLVTSTFFNTFVTPALFYKFGGAMLRRQNHDHKE